MAKSCRGRRSARSNQEARFIRKGDGDHDTRLYLYVAIVLVRDGRVSRRGKEMEIRPGHVITSATNPIEHVRPSRHLIRSGGDRIARDTQRKDMIPTLEPKLISENACRQRVRHRKILWPDRATPNGSEQQQLDRMLGASMPCAMRACPTRRGEATPC